MKPIEKQLDALWSELVKLRAGNRCEVCGKSEYLNSHHVYSRAKKSVRWQIENGFCLCPGCHIGSKFSPHKTPNDFVIWSIEKRGQTWFDLLQAKAHSIVKLHPFEKKLLAEELKKEIKQFNTGKYDPNRPHKPINGSCKTKRLNNNHSQTGSNKRTINKPIT